MCTKFVCTFSQKINLKTLCIVDMQARGLVRPSQLKMSCNIILFSVVSRLFGAMTVNGMPIDTRTKQVANLGVVKG